MRFKEWLNEQVPAPGQPGQQIVDPMNTGYNWATGTPVQYDANKAKIFRDDLMKRHQQVQQMQQHPGQPQAPGAVPRVG